jgi:biotin transport system substrate-specific component
MERRVTLIALFAALVAALSWLPKLDLVSGVPITAQSLGIMLCGTILGRRDGALAVLLYLLLAAIGLPVLAGGRGGLGVFFGPTGGYLVGFVAAAFVTGWLVEKLPLDIGWSAFIGSIAGGVVALHVFGVVGMALVLSKSVPDAAWLAVPFLVGDLIKAGLAATITRSLHAIRPDVAMRRE